MRLTIGIDADGFARAIAHEVAAGGLTVVDIAERLLGENMSDAIVAALGHRLVKAPQPVVHPSYFKQRFATLHGLSKSGYETWYPEVRFSTHHADEVSVSELDLRGIESEAISYGFGVERMFHFVKKQLRTQTNHLLRLNKVRIPGVIFDAATRHVLCGQSPSQPFVANLTLGAEIVGFRLVAFDHVLTGQRVFCACHQSTHEAMLEDASARAPGYVRGSWPHKFVDALRGAEYVPGVCHLCLTVGAGSKEAIAVYGDSVQSHPEAYIDLLVRRDKLDPATAKADVSSRLGIARWVNEAKLFGLVKKLFPDASPDDLERYTTPWHVLPAGSQQDSGDGLTRTQRRVLEARWIAYVSVGLTPV